MSEEIKRGKGRPREEAARRYVHPVRFGEDEEAMLEDLKVESDDNTSDIMRKALKVYYNIQTARRKYS